MLHSSRWRQREEEIRQQRRFACCGRYVALCCTSKMSHVGLAGPSLLLLFEVALFYTGCDAAAMPWCMEKFVKK
jgi:hypothetical protein